MRMAIANVGLNIELQAKWLATTNRWRTMLRHSSFASEAKYYSTACQVVFFLVWFLGDI